MRHRRIRPTDRKPYQSRFKARRNVDFSDFLPEFHRRILFPHHVPERSQMVTLPPATPVTSRRTTHHDCSSPSTTATSSLRARLTGGWTSVALFAALLFVLQPANLAANDWTYWRGPESNGISRETGLIDDWDAKGTGADGKVIDASNVAWRRDDLGGRSTPIVMDGRLYTIVRADPGTPREGEKVVCVDAASGKTIWENRFNVYLSDVPAERLGLSLIHI